MPCDKEDALLFCGENSAFIGQRTDLNAERYVDVPVHDDAPFPYGAKGLLPVVTSRKKKGGFKTVYAFPFDTCEADMEDELQRELSDAVGFINLLLSEARDLSGYDFGAIAAILTQIPAKGYGFTRVELMGKGDEEGASSAPVHLRIETTDKPGEPNSLNAVIEYDKHGYVLHVLMTEYGENGETCRVMASYDNYYREVLVQKVVLVEAKDAEPKELYRRYYDNRYSD